MTEEPNPSDVPPRELFRLKVPPVFGPRFFGSMLFAVGFVVVLFARPLLAQGDGLFLLGLVALAAIFPSVVALVSASGRRRSAASIEVLTDRVLLPTGGVGRVALRFSAFRGLFIRRHRFAGFLYLATDEREMVFPLHSFADNEAERLYEALRRRVRASGADGERRLAAIDRSSRVADRAYARTPMVTWGTLGVLSLVHIYFLGTGLLATRFDIASLGGTSPELVEAAGPYLALTSSWVHEWQFQPLLVFPAFLVVGTMVERLLGHGITATALLSASALGGLAASYFPGAPIHSGSLVLVAAMVGVLAHVAQNQRGQMPIGFRLSGQWWTWVASVVAVAALVQSVSLPALLLGFLSGVAMGVSALDREPEVPLVYSPRWTLPVAGLLAALHLGAVGWALEDLQGRGLSLEKVALEHSENPIRLREHAVHVVGLEPPASRARLELAKGAVERAIKLTSSDRNRAFFSLTLAKLLDRLGEPLEAIQILHGTLREFPEGRVFAAGLAELLEAKDGVVALNGAATASVSIELKRDGLSFTSEVKLKAPLSDDQVFFGAVPGSTEVIGLIRVPVRASVTSTSVKTAWVGDAETEDWPEGPLTVVPRLTAPGRADGKLWPTAVNPSAD